MKVRHESNVSHYKAVSYADGEDNLRHSTV